MDEKSITQLTLTPGYKVSLEKDDKDKKPRFSMIGKDTMDLVDIVVALPKAEQALVLRIKNSIKFDAYEKEYCPIVRIKPTEEGLTKTQVQTMSRALKSLRTKGIICKTHPYNYMINPDMLIPSNYKKYKRVWDDTAEAEYKPSLLSGGVV